MFRTTIALLFLLSTSLFSIDFIRDENLDKHSIFNDIILIENELFIMTTNIIKNSSNQKVLGLFKYDSQGNFTELPNTYIENNIEKNIYLDIPNFFVSNSKGEIYASCKGLFKFSNNIWTKVNIDEKDSIRKITNMTFDIYDNLWLTTSIKSNELQIDSSELLKFENKKFSKIYETNFRGSFTNGVSKGKAILALNNGKVSLQRYWQQPVDNDEMEKYNNNDLWFFDQEGNIETELIHTSGPLPYYEEYGLKSPYHINKKVYDMFETSDSKLYISTDKISLQRTVGNESYFISCCEGISYLDENKVWKIYKENDGLPKYYNESDFERFNSVYAINELSNGQIIFSGLQGFYLIDKYEKIQKLNEEKILNEGKMIVIGKELEDPYVFDYTIGQYFKANEKNLTDINGFEKIHYSENGDIFLMHPRGILILNENQLITNSIETNSILEANIYPNPSEDYISISGISNNSTYEIINILGNKVSEGRYHQQIDISNLIIGHYYLNINNSTNNKTLKFIKK